MIDKKTTVQEIEGLSLEELEAHSGEYLPDREEMSLVNANIATPVNVAFAANIFSDNSTAIANAEQNNFIQQQNDVQQNGFGQDRFGNGDFMRDEELANVNFAAPTNTAVAANIASDDSFAFANAEQNNAIQQGNFVEQNDFEDDFEDRDEDEREDRDEDEREDRGGRR